MLNADIESQKAVAPLLQNKVLRRVIQTFTNDENGDMQRWACNPEVLRLLYEAKKRMEDGTVSEDEMERLLLEQFQVSIIPPEQVFVSAIARLYEAN